MLNQPNPYEPPAVDLGHEVVASHAARDAELTQRLGAALIDSAINMALIAPMQIWAGVYEHFPATQQSYAQGVLWAAAGFVVMLVVHGHFLAESAQTIGKKLLKIQVVNVSDLAPAPFKVLVWRRLLPVTLATIVPLIGPVLVLANVLFIFRASRRCLHDEIAGTRVIQL